MVGFVYEHYCKRCTTEEENEKLKKKLERIRNDMIEVYKYTKSEEVRDQIGLLINRWQEEEK